MELTNEPEVTMTNIKLGDRIRPAHNSRLVETIVAIDGDDVVTLYRYSYQGQQCRKAQVYSRAEIERYYEIEHN